MKKPKEPLPELEIIGRCEMWRMKTYKGLLYTLQEVESQQLYQVFRPCDGKRDMSCSCGKQEQSKLCPHIKFLSALPSDGRDRVIEGSLIILDEVPGSLSSQASTDA
jgi:hypothetical protein